MAKTWVIGGIRGIGEAIAQHLERYNISVLPTDETDADVTSTRQLRKAFDAFQPDGIVYCAGINKLMPAKIFDEFDAMNMLNINVLGFMRVVSIATQNPGIVQSIVAVSSDAATHPMRNSMAYCASKAALNMAVHCAARELAPYVQVNAVSPGPIASTPMTDVVNQQVAIIKGWPLEKVEQDAIAGIPMCRLGEKEEVAQAVHQLLFGPRYLTGAILEINGGR